MGEDLKLLKQGAEAKLYIHDYLGKLTLIKERFPKKYRVPDLDNELTKERITTEARSIVRSKKACVRTPAIYLVDFEKRRIYMEYFNNSVTIKDFIIDHGTTSNHFESVVQMIGEAVRKLHDNSIIHGDLTTSNMLLIPKLPNYATSIDPEWLSDGHLELAMIDFGLSHVDGRTEEKGVDLYVLERALISTHNDYPGLFDSILESYKNFNKAPIDDVLDKFEEVRARGRKRTMIG